MPTLPIPDVTLTPTWGYAFTRSIQCKNQDRSIPTVWQSTDTLSGTIAQSQGYPALVTFTPTWFDASLCQVTIPLTAANTSALAADTTYWLEITGTRAGTTYPLAFCWCQVLPSPGSTTVGTFDLVTYPYAARILGSLSLSPAQLEMIPTLITSCSAAWQKWCNRLFIQNTYVETLPVELDGTIRVAQPPINSIGRIQSWPQTALTVQNYTATSAWSQLAYTGDVTTGQTITGLTLSWELNGLFDSTTILFSSLANPQITSLATAINAVGSGWSANADQTLGLYPVTEILTDEGLIAMGCGANDQPADGAIYRVYTSNITNARFITDRGQYTGIVWVGRQNDSQAWRWGPGGEEMWGSGDGGVSRGKVKATYNGGFATIPPFVQQGVVELVKACLTRLDTDMLLQSESDGEYAYELADKMILMMPPYIIQGMNAFRVENA
jgi:hypothetical protein